MRSVRASMLALFTVLLVAGMVCFPERAFQASLAGLKIWWHFVFPALLPYMILMEILSGLGWIHRIGAFFGPLMRPLFRLPGICGLPVGIGIIAGFPAGVRTAALFRAQNWISREEGNRLLALSYASSPVLILIVVAAGFFQNIAIGWLLLGAHGLGWLVAALFLARPVRHSGKQKPLTAPAEAGIVNRASRADGRGFGELLGAAVQNTMQTLLVAGGYIMLFSVTLALAKASGLFPAMTAGIALAGASFHLPAEAAASLLTGLFEVHLGTHEVSRTALPADWQAALAAALLGFGGLSVHAQAKHLIAGTDLSLVVYWKYRMVHAVFSAVIALIAYRPFMRLFPAQSSFALSGLFGEDNPLPLAQGDPSLWPYVHLLMAWGFIWTAALCAFSLLCLWTCGFAARRRRRP